MRKRLMASFSGTVQGVGFRFTTERIARDYQVAGYVRNLPDGKVEVAAEGEENELQRFLQAVRESNLAPYIRDVRVKWDEARDRFQKFSIAI